MLPLDFFLTPLGLACTEIQATPQTVTLALQALSATACCPVCGQSTTRVHSRYQRALADLPWQGRPLHLRLTVRRFFCPTAGCPRRIFAERFPGLAAVRARTTDRLTHAHQRIGLAVGGEAGARLASFLGVSMRWSPNISATYR